MLDELRQGLLALGFIGLMDQHPALRSLFQKNESTKLTADIVQDIFLPVFIPAGSNRRVTEEATM